jgi:hypothetical protein
LKKGETKVPKNIHIEYDRDLDSCVLVADSKPDTLEETFEIAFRKWVFLRNYYTEKRSEALVRDSGPTTCGLCMLFIENDCAGCPIAAAGHKRCSETPYENYVTATNHDADFNRIAEICDNEIKFLKDILNIYLKEAPCSKS